MSCTVVSMFGDTLKVLLMMFDHDLYATQLILLYDFNVPPRAADLFTPSPAANFHAIKLLHIIINSRTMSRQMENRGVVLVVNLFMHFGRR